MSDDVPNLRGTSWTTVAAIVMPLVTLVVMFGGFVWQAAKYPDRADYIEMNKSVSDLKIAVPVLQTKLEGVGNSVQKLSNQMDRIEGKQDAQRRK